MREREEITSFKAEDGQLSISLSLSLSLTHTISLLLPPFLHVLELSSSVNILGLLGVKIANRGEVITFQSIFEIELGGGFQNGSVVAVIAFL